MITKGRTFWEEKGNLMAGSTLEEADNCSQERARKNRKN
jgi:hypothetical protein